jgi:hypothetical protein
MHGITTNEKNKISDGIQNKLDGKDEKVIHVLFIPKSLLTTKEINKIENNDKIKTLKVISKYLALLFIL